MMKLKLEGLISPYVMRYILIIWLGLVFCSCEFGQKFTVDNVTGVAPAGWTVGEVPQTDPKQFGFGLYNDSSFMIIYVFRNTLSKKHMFETYKRMAEHTIPLKEISGARYDEERFGKLGQFETIEVDFFNSTENGDLKGRTIVLSEYDRNYIIMMVSIGESDNEVLGVLNSLSFEDVKYELMEVKEEMILTISAINEKLPQKINEEMIYHSAIVENNTIVQTYNLTYESEQDDWVDYVDDNKELQLSQIINSYSGILEQWFEDGGEFKCVYRDSRDKPLFSIIISQSDIDKYKMQLK